MRKNVDLTGEVCPPHTGREQYDLLRRYLDARHEYGGMADMTPGDYVAMVEETAVDTFVTEYRNTDGDLLACLLGDRMRDGISLVYSFFDPLADKLNKQRLVEQSDFAAAKDTFGGADAGDSALDSFLPKTEADFIEYAGMVAAKLTNYDNSAYYKVLLKEVLRKATENLSSEETKQISTSMTVLVNEKQKEEKAKQGDKKKKKNQKKAVVMERDDEYEMFGPGGGNTGYADECVPRARVAGALCRPAGMVKVAILVRLGMATAGPRR